jgi:putative tryptophan/tyrosine transport system substrate-binding protein
MIDRRNFANALALGLLCAPAKGQAQPAQRLPVVGTLTGRVRGRALPNLIMGLRAAGYEEGRNYRFENRFSEGNPAAFAGLAPELVKLEVEVIFALGPAAARAARDATRTIPIVALDLETDPVQAGWAHSLARPGGNLTGLFLDVPAVAGKWIELLRAAAPELRRVGLLWDSSTGPAQLDAARAAAKGMGIEIQVMEIRRVDGIEAALRAGVGSGIKGIVLLGSPLLSSSTASKQVADFAAKNRLPAISPFRVFPDAGGLMSYGHNEDEFQPRAGGFVARILKGEKPGDMAIELPTKIALVISLKSARALGLTIPQALLLRADEVIQ